MMETGDCNGRGKRVVKKRRGDSTACDSETQESNLRAKKKGKKYFHAVATHPLTHSQNGSAAGSVRLKFTIFRMVQHNDKWKKKATREYHRKHGTVLAGRGRGRGRGQAGDLPEEFALPGENEAPADQNAGQEASAESNEDEDDKEGREALKEQWKYSRRKIESNAWRFQSDEPDPYLGIIILQLLVTHR
jgi:hypothetical protein